MEDLLIIEDGIITVLGERVTLNQTENQVLYLGIIDFDDIDVLYVPIEPEPEEDLYKILQDQPIYINSGKNDSIKSMMSKQNGLSHVDITDIDVPEGISDLPNGLISLNEQEKEVQEDVFSVLEGKTTHVVNKDTDDDILDMIAEQIDDGITFEGDLLVQVTYNYHKIGDIVAENISDPDVAKKKQMALVTQAKIANYKLKNRDIVLRTIRMKGLPNWIIPIVRTNPVKLQTDYVGDFRGVGEGIVDDFSEKGCTVELEIPRPYVRSSEAMATDENLDVPGSWLTERIDYNPYVVYDFDTESQYNMVRRTEGNKYKFDVKLTDKAKSTLANTRNKVRPVVYSRLLGVPGSIASTDTEKIHERNVRVVGLMKRNPGTSPTEPLTGKEYIYRIDCSEGLTYDDILKKHYKTPRQVLELYEGRLTNMTVVEKVLRTYQYDLSDLTVGDISYIAPYIKEFPENSTWNKKVHPQETGDHVHHTLPTDNVDGGKFHYCNLLSEYVSRNKGKRTLKLQEKTVGKGIRLPLHINGVHDDGDLYFQYGDLWYTAEDYSRIVYNQSVRAYNNLAREMEDEKVVKLRCREFKQKLSNIKKYHAKLAGITTVTPAPEISPVVKVLNSADTDDIYYETLKTFIHSGLVEKINHYYRVKSTGELVCCEHVYRELNKEDISDILSVTGSCIYCFSEVIENNTEVDFNQVTRVLARDIYMSETIDVETDKSYYMQLLIDHILSTIEKYKLTNNNKTEIKASVLSALGENVDIFRAYSLPSRPFGNHDFLENLLYGDMSIIERNQKKIKINTKYYSILVAHVSKVTGIDLSGMKIGDKIHIEHLVKFAKKFPSNASIYCTVLLPQLTEIYSMVVNSAVNVITREYNDAYAGYNILEEYSVNGLNFLIDLFNGYMEKVNTQLDKAEKAIKVAVVDNKDFIMKEHSLVRKLFSGKFDKDIIEKMKLLGNTDFSTMIELAGEPPVDEATTPIADLQKNYRGLNVHLTGYVQSPPTNLRTLEDRDICIGKYQQDGASYLQELWTNYQNVPMVNDPELMKSYQYLIPASRKIMQYIGDDEDYIKDEEEFESLLPRKIRESNRPVCKFNEPVATKNMALKHTEVYTKNQTIDIRGTTEPQPIAPVRVSSKLLPNFAERLKILIEYSKDDGYNSSLGSLFSNYAHLFTSNIPRNSRKFILQREMRKAEDRKQVVIFNDTEKFMPNKSMINELETVFGMDMKEWPSPTKVPELDPVLARRKFTRVQNLGNMVNKFFHWISDKENKVDMNLVHAANVLGTGRNVDFVREKDPVDTDGFYLLALAELKTYVGDKSLRLNKFHQYIPELYSMSYSEIIEHLDDSVDKTHETVINLIFAAIRFDLLMHNMITMSDSSKNIRDIINSVPADINNLAQNSIYNEFLNKFFNALDNGVLDPDRDLIDAVYNIRLLEKIAKKVVGKEELADMGVNVKKSTYVGGEVDEEDEGGEEYDDEEGDDDEEAVNYMEEVENFMELTGDIENY